MNRHTTRLNRFKRIRDQLARLIRDIPDPLARRATAVALLHHKIPNVSWTGFYMLRGGELLVDVYQGPLACLKLAPHTGVCWAAINTGTPLAIPDVTAFAGHIPCDARTRSELVVPLPGPGGEPAGVLDVDSRHLARFDTIDLEGYGLVVETLIT